MEESVRLIGMNGNTHIYASSDGSTTTTNSHQSWTDYPLGMQSWVSSNTVSKKEEVKDMRGLFNVYVVDYKNDQVIAEGLIIADDEAKAKMKALHKWNDVTANYDLDDLDIICVKLGSIRKKREVQKVEIVESE